MKFRVYYTVKTEKSGSAFRWQLDRSFDSMKEALDFLAAAQTPDLTFDTFVELQIVKGP